MAVLALLGLVACTGQPVTVTSSASSSTIPTTSTTSTPSTSTSTPTTTQPAYDVHYELWIYDSFESPDANEVGVPCFGVGDRISIRQDARIAVRDDASNEVVATESLPEGMVEHDDTGPPVGELGYELFYRCSFDVEFVDMDLVPEGTYRVEFPGGTTSDLITTDDLVRGIATGFLRQDLEAERQRIRQEQ